MEKTAIGKIFHLFEDSGRIMYEKRSDSDSRSESEPEVLDFDFGDVVTPPHQLIEYTTIVSFEMGTDEHGRAKVVNVKDLTGTRRIGTIDYLNDEGFYSSLIDQETEQQLDFRFVGANVEPVSRNKLVRDCRISYELKFNHPDIIPFNIRFEG